MSKNYFYTLTEVVSESFDIEPYTDLNVMSDDGTKVLATLTKAGSPTSRPCTGSGLGCIGAFIATPTPLTTFTRILDIQKISPCCVNYTEIIIQKRS